MIENCNEEQHTSLRTIDAFIIVVGAAASAVSKAHKLTVTELCGK